MSKVKIIPKFEATQRTENALLSNGLLTDINNKIKNAADHGKRNIEITQSDGLLDSNYQSLKDKLTMAGYTVLCMFANSTIYSLEIEW